MMPSMEPVRQLSTPTHMPLTANRLRWVSPCRSFSCLPLCCQDSGSLCSCAPALALLTRNSLETVRAWRESQHGLPSRLCLCYTRIWLRINKQVHTRMRRRERQEHDHTVYEREREHHPGQRARGDGP